MLYYVKALYDFEAGNSEELNFQEGDILAVNDETNPDWYEAEFNGMIGMVPKNYFEAVNDEAGYGDEYDDDWSSSNSSSVAGSTVYPDFTPKPKRQVMILHVLYDYQAQLPDELTVYEGDILQVIDDSDPDWYEAKPVTKLGASGLVPKNYCEIEDMSTSASVDVPTNKAKKGEDPEKARQREEEARAKEEERRRKAEQKQKERAEREKDKAESDKRKEAERIEREKRKEEERIEREKRKEEERKRKEEEARIQAERIAAEKAAFRGEYGQQLDDNITTVRVTYFEKRADKKYYFTVEVYRTNGNRVIYRTYQDFYDFHIRLLDCFPGDSDGATRIIPYLPGQKLFVNDAVSKERRAELDEYTQALFKLPTRITRSKIVVEFFRANGMDDVYSQSLMNSGSPAPAAAPAAPAAAANRPGPTRTLGSTAPAPGRREEENIPPPPSRRPPPPGQGTAPQRPAQAPPRPTSGIAPPKPTGGPPGSANRFGSSPGSGGGMPAKVGSSPQFATSAPSTGKPPPPRGPPPASSSPPINDPPASRFGGSGGAGAAPRPAGPNPSSNRPMATNGAGAAGGPMVKIKVYHKEDIVAFVMPKSARFAQVKEKSFKKLAMAPKALQFKDEDGDMVTMAGDDDWQMALDSHPQKLCLYVS